MSKIIRFFTLITIIFVLLSSVVYALSDITNETRTNNAEIASQGRMPVTNLVRKYWCNRWYI
ncbi:MAG: hypothetical protein IKR04_02615 [Clostridia bacterium]|nr:hypothetical protein [Clostridia bacterium]